MAHRGKLNSTKLPQLTRHTTNYDKFYESKGIQQFANRSLIENATRWHECTKSDVRISGTRKFSDRLDQATN
jgi:hypothetical protein